MSHQVSTNNNNISKKRETNIEVLRILAMLMIILAHCALYGIFRYWHINTTIINHINTVITGIGLLGGAIGVDIFVIITGYFMVNSQFKLNKFLKLYLTTICYTLIFLSIALIYGEHQVSLKILFKSLFPFGGNTYWFISTYLMLYLFTPFINKFIHQNSTKTLNIFLGLTTILWCIIPTFSPALYCFSNLVWFIYLYFIGAALQLKSFATIILNKNIINKITLIGLIILLAGIIMHYLHAEVNTSIILNNLRKMNSIFIITIAIYLFQTIKQINIPYNKFINWISASVLGVYLFHENLIVRPFLWGKILHPYTYMDSPFLILYMIACGIIVFFAGIIFDKIIHFVFDNVINKICELIKKFLNRFSDFEI